MKVTYQQALTAIIAMLEAGVNGAEIVATYIEEQAQLGELTDRELTLRAWRRSDEAAMLCDRALRRIEALERRA